VGDALSPSIIPALRINQFPDLTQVLYRTTVARWFKLKPFNKVIKRRRSKKKRRRSKKVACPLTVASALKPAP
jgi:hypothetical protein